MTAVVSSDIQISQGCVAGGLPPLGEGREGGREGREGGLTFDTSIAVHEDPLTIPHHFPRNRQSLRRVNHSGETHRHHDFRTWCRRRHES